MKLRIILSGVVFLLLGCTSRSPDIAHPVQNRDLNTTKSVQQGKVAQTPQDTIELKKVEDDNYSSAYMYPQTRVKKAKRVKAHNRLAAPSSSDSMNRAECIAMIGIEKFNKYTQMFGNESASITRCKMLKAMQ